MSDRLGAPSRSVHAWLWNYIPLSYLIFLWSLRLLQNLNLRLLPRVNLTITQTEYCVRCPGILCCL